MKRTLFLIIVLFGLASSNAFALPGDSWILPIDNLVGSGWTEYSGAGYGGSSAWGASGMDGTRRVYWALNDSTIPTTTELYTIEWFRPTQGTYTWQPIESQFNGTFGETYPTESNIPWAGTFGTNHQYIGTNVGTVGTWVSTGPGPHTPESADYNAGDSGIYMWLEQGSWLYAKWDFGWSIDNTWSALRITQVTSNGVPGVVPEPTTMLLLGCGLFGLWGARRKLKK